MNEETDAELDSLGKLARFLDEVDGGRKADSGDMRASAVWMLKHLPDEAKALWNAATRLDLEDAKDTHGEKARAMMKLSAVPNIRESLRHKVDEMFAEQLAKARGK